MSEAAAIEPEAAGTPVRPGQRIVTLDVLRGVALLGIFIMNMPGFTHSLFAQPPADPGTLDRIVDALRDGLFAGKFNLLFGLLFGIGFTLQLGRLEAAHSARAVWIYARRLAALLAIGLVHAVLLWPGDVLVVYAVLGFVLLAIRKVPERVVLVLLAFCLLYPAAADALRPSILSIQSETIATFEYEDFEASNNAAFGHGSFLDAARETARVFAWGYTSPLGLFSYATFYVQMATGILLGFVVGRRGWIGRLAQLGGALSRAQIVAAAIVVVSAIAWALVPAVDPFAASSAPQVFASGLAKTVGRAALMAFYALTVVRWLQRPGASRWTLPFERAGRMPLTNYLLQTVMASFVFYGWGLGGWGRSGPALETLLAVMLFVVVQMPLSVWWLGRFRYGPVEYLWRLVTYGRAAL